MRRDRAAIRRLLQSTDTLIRPKTRHGRASTATSKGLGGGTCVGDTCNGVVQVQVVQIDTDGSVPAQQD